MTLIDLTEISADQLTDVGGKAVGLARLIHAGEQVPAGFVITTDAHRAGTIPRTEVIQWWRDRLDGAPVAVPSSATAEDLAEASFAGQQDTILNVTDEEDLINAIQQCWDSLHSERAKAYRASAGIAESELAMGVVVQAMVDASAAGVLFTANPVTGQRTQQVVDATAGLGDVVVDGSIDPDHAELDDGVPPTPVDCLDGRQLAELQRAGRRVERALGSPQDIEFAFDQAGSLWLLQSRAITTLFPVPDEADGQLHVYVEVGHMQGLTGPMTPMGESLMSAAIDGVVGVFGELFREWVHFIGGRMYFDLSPMLRSKSLRKQVPGMLGVYGSTPAVGEILLRDPRLQPVKKTFAQTTETVRGIAQLIQGMGPGIIFGMMSGLYDPAAARVRAWTAPVMTPTVATTAEGKLAEARAVQDQVMQSGMWEMLPALYGGLASRQIAASLLGGIAEPGEVDITQRGMPHNPTTTMDLALWEVAERAAEHRELFADTEPADLVERWRSGTLPEIGLDDFLATYGHRCALEIDVGMPRWADDPAPVFTVIAGYLQITDPEQAPDVRFERAAAEGEAMIATLVARAEQLGKPRRGGLAGWLLWRSRELAGLREYPKFAWVKAIRQGRELLVEVGNELVERGMLDAADDIFMLDLDEAERALAGEEVRELAASRRLTYDRESRRVQVPSVLLSDGTMPAPAAAALDGDAIIGRPAAAGVATGRARVVRDPRTARIEPGEILVAPTTDPGWTPLFLTAGGLVSDTGSPVAHGPTAAREYGIPAVIGIPDATTRFVTGDLLTIDGSRGTVVVEQAAGAASVAPMSA